LQILSRERFTSIYAELAEQVFSFWTEEMQESISRHCIGWSKERFDFKNYLNASSTRCYLAYRELASLPNVTTVCDVGGYWGVFPMVLKKVGFDVAMTEALQYYGESFTPLFDFIRSQGVRVIDFDPFQPDQPSPGTFDAVTIMAVLEHYPHSLEVFMKSVKTMVKPGGHFYIEVPNLAFLPNRFRFLLGDSPLVPAEDIYRSAVPFIGHHHEFTAGELSNLVTMAGLKPLKAFAFNYSDGGGLRAAVRRPVHALFYLTLPNTRECLALVARA
jgi:SAM-dependent methyltransferase